MTTPQSRTQRLTARSIIASFVILGLVILFVPSGALGAMFLQQQTGSPTGSGSPSGSPSEASPSPSPTGVQAIQFINPSSHSDVVSTKDDGTNTTYHLVAAVRTVPANPVVEFKYQSGDANEVSIGIATRVGTTDTWHFQWPAAGLADGSYVLKAILYNGSLELGRDEEEVALNNDDAIDDPQAETVEIVSPAAGADAGFFQPEGQATAHVVVALTSSDDAGLPSGSSGTDAVAVFYTKTPIGEEPEWIDCAEAGTEGEGDPQTTVRCSLAEGDTALSVTGLAAVANPFLPLIGGSGDAHRVFPYVQEPTNITLAPASQAGKAPGTCADLMTATVLDQNGQPIAGINTDVHAKAPSDDLRFGSGDDTSEFQAPDKAHTEPEEAWDCAAEDVGGEQGDHELSPGNPDIKHIETVADGTADNGTFAFQLYSPDGPGTTNLGVFADTDDDDLWCATEESTTGSVGWSASASPAPTPSESPSESQSPSGSPAGTSSPTSSPEPTTVGPELATCPRATGSASPTSTAGATERAINLDASRRKATAGARVALSGIVQDDKTACEDGVAVEITRRLHGTNRFRNFKTTATDAEGDYRVRVRVKKSADYQASVPAEGDCEEASSDAEAVRVRAKVTIKASDATPSSGSTVTLKGKVSPNHKGDNVVLQRRRGKKWVKVATDELNRRSRYAFAVAVDWSGARKFRVRWPKQAPTNIAGVSRALALRAT